MSTKPPDDDEAETNGSKTLTMIRLSSLGRVKPGCSVEDVVQNPLEHLSEEMGNAPSLPTFSSCSEESDRGLPPGEVPVKEAVESQDPVDGDNKGGFVISTVVVVALVISLGVITVGLVGFLPGHLIGFRAVSGTAELIQTESVMGVIIIMRSTILQLPDFAHTVNANYMRNQTSPYTVDAFPKTSKALLYSLLSVLSTFKDKISFFQFMYKKGLYGLASETVKPYGKEPGVLFGANNEKMELAPIMKYNATYLDVLSPVPVGNWNISHRLTRKGGPFEVIVNPWVKNHSVQQRWYPDDINHTSLYFDFVIPFQIDDFAGYCEVGMSAYSILKESRGLISALRHNGRVMLFDDKRDIVILTSWGEATSSYNKDGPVLSFSPLRLEDIKDSIAAGVARQVLRQKDEFKSIKDNIHEVTFSYGKDKVMASFARVTDKNGIDIMLSVAVLRSDFFSSIENARLVIIMIVVVIVVISAVLAFVGACYLVKPLTHVAKALKKASNLELSADDTKMIKPSRILEVGEIQADYVKLLRQLLVLRQFVPEAILARVNHEGESSDLLRGSGDSAASMPFSDSNPSQSSTSDLYKKRGLKLNSGIFRDQLNTFSPKYCSVVAIEFHASHFLEDSMRYMSALVTSAAELSGCVEVISPDKFVVSFGAHTTLPMHTSKACGFAFAFFSKLISSEQEIVTIVVESKEFLLGTCGAFSRNARVLFPIDYLFELTKAMNGASYHIAATSGMASQIVDYQAFPVDCIYLPSCELPVVLYELRLMKTNREQIQSITKHFRLGFAAMRQGHYRQAITHYRRIDNSDPQAQRLIRLCMMRRQMKDTTPYMWTVENPYDIKVNTLDKSSFEILCASPNRKRKSTNLQKEVKEPEKETQEIDDTGLFQMYQFSSSSSEETNTDVQTGEGGYCGTDDMPHVLTDMNHKVWTLSLEKISEGAFSTVFLGISEDGVQVAIKCIPRRRRDIMQENLEAEMNVASKLCHPNIVQYVSCSVVQSHLAIIMEYVPGGSLHTVIKSFGRVSSLVARRFTVDILNGLNYLHTLGIVHCDVKPHNVLLGMDGVCKLSDFGSTISEATEMARTMEDDLVLRGTALYMAPEVAAGGRCTPQSDIFSLGISLLELLLGRLPWRWTSKAPEGSDATSLQALFNRDHLFVQSLARGCLEPEIPEFLESERFPINKLPEILWDLPAPFQVQLPTLSKALDRA